MNRKAKTYRRIGQMSVKKTFVILAKATKLLTHSAGLLW